MRIRIDVDDRDAQRALARLVRAGGDLEPALRGAGEILLNSARERFRSQQSPEGVPWAPLKPRTVARKRRNKHLILTEEGWLRGSLAVGAISRDSVVVGSPEIYGATHQFGRGAIPARPFLGVSAEDKREIGEELADFVRRAWRG